MTLDQIEDTARGAALAVFGVVQPEDDPILPDDCKSLILLGPNEPGFWDQVTASPEFLDGAPDPLDRWSTRMISALAADLGGKAIFPFGGPPYAPFQRWAIDSGRAWVSPVGFLVHETAGLWVSYRGAIALPYTVDDQQKPTSPCGTCMDKPCLSACPVGALSATGYNLDACHAYLDGPGQQSCMVRGCEVRMSCPAGVGYGRMPAQSAFHMIHFHK